MEAIGRLATGVAHDFGNLLTVILGYSDLLLDRIPANDTLAGMVSEIKATATRAAALTRQLLAFCQQQALAPQVLDLNAVVADLEKILRRLIGEDIEFVVALDPALGPIKADRGQVEQVVINLAVNARDAMPLGGKLTIETHNAERSAVQSGRKVVLVVRDTGHGMDAATRERMLEPFFTTKPPGQGTGIGLATVSVIVQQSGGQIDVTSAPGLGTSVTISWNCVEGPNPANPEAPSLSPSPGGQETVLVVEDEEVVRSYICKALQQKGYTVLEAGPASGAIQFGIQYPEPIHLLVSDVVMPQMSGQELASRLTVMRPSIKVLYLSGYTKEEVTRHGVLEPGTAFLQKPFTPDALARKVREVLDR
jgi:CheY-like chemotaxis protein